MFIYNNVGQEQSGVCDFGVDLVVQFVVVVCLLLVPCYVIGLVKGKGRKSK